MSTKTRLTVDEFLALPETEPVSELIDGEVVQKVSPNLRHGVLAVEIGALLRAHLLPTRAGVVAVEVRHSPAGRTGRRGIAHRLLRKTDRPLRRPEESRRSTPSQKADVPSGGGDLSNERGA